MSYMLLEKKVVPFTRLGGKLRAIRFSTSIKHRFFFKTVPKNPPLALDANWFSLKKSPPQPWTLDFFRRGDYEISCMIYCTLEQLLEWNKNESLYLFWHTEITNNSERGFWWIWKYSYRESYRKWLLSHQSHWALIFRCRSPTERKGVPLSITER